MLRSATGRYRPPRTEKTTCDNDSGYLGRLRAARIGGAEKPEFVKIKLKSQPELGDQAASQSGPIERFPSRTRAAFDHPAPIVLNAQAAP